VDRGRRLGLEDLMLGVTLVGYQVALLLAMRDTTTTDDGDPFDSTLYRSSWLLLPAAALLASFIRPDGRRPAAIVGFHTWLWWLLARDAHSTAGIGPVMYRWLIGPLAILIVWAVAQERTFRQQHG
jgi:hypothetical protein